MVASIYLFFRFSKTKQTVNIAGKGRVTNSLSLIVAIVATLALTVKSIKCT